MSSLSHVVSKLSELQHAMTLAAHWLTDIAQIRTEKLTRGEKNSRGYPYTDWRGGFRGEYSVARDEWDFMGMVWHGGQAVKALVAAHRVTGETKLLDSAVLGAQFILRHQLTDGPDAGLLLAYENRPDTVNSSAVLEALDGLLHLSEATDDPTYRDAAIAAARWQRDHAWQRGAGLVLDMYDPRTRSFLDKSFDLDANSRPLADDAMWLKMYQLTGEDAFREIFYEVMERLLRDERPAGNWIDYEPCRPSAGWIHPRHAYWWGYPMLAAWRDAREQRFLDAAIRSATWYLQAQRKDGGMFRQTYLDFNTHCFSHATSGTACAAIFWLDLFEETGDPRWLEPILRSLKYIMSVQFTKPKDDNLRGCILERLVPPDGTDNSPYHIRDLGTIFFVQAAATLLQRASLTDPASTRTAD